MNDETSIAEVDQLHAQALDALRKADAFVLVTFRYSDGSQGSDRFESFIGNSCHPEIVRELQEWARDELEDVLDGQAPRKH